MKLHKNKEKNICQIGRSPIENYILNYIEAGCLNTIDRNVLKDNKMKHYFKTAKQLLFTVITGLFSLSAFTSSAGKKKCHKVFSESESESESEELEASYQDVIDYIKSCEADTKEKVLDLIFSADWPYWFPKRPHIDYKEWDWGDLDITDKPKQKKSDNRSRDSLTEFLNKTSEYPVDSDDYFELPNEEDEVSGLKTH